MEHQEEIVTTFRHVVMFAHIFVACAVSCLCRRIRGTFSEPPGPCALEFCWKHSEMWAPGTCIL